MRRIAFLLAASCAALAFGGVAAAVPDSDREERDAVPNELIVGFEDGVSTDEAKRIVRRAGAETRKTLKTINAILVSGEPGQLATVRKVLASDPRVVYVEPNAILRIAAVPNDPSLSRLWGLVNTGQSVGGTTGTPDADIDADVAWDVTTGSGDVVVAVIDTGVALSHPDLVGQAWTNPDEVAGDRIDNDRNGYVDDVNGWDFANNDANPHDDNEHGTHVAGTIGARGNNGVGIVGVNWRVKIMALKFLDAGGGGSLADAIDAIAYAAREGAHILNNSWGGGGYSQALADAITAAEEAGALFVAAAGNSGGNSDQSPMYPAAYSHASVISVAATDNRDRLASFSNYGRTSVDLGAPGVDVYSTVPGNTYDSFSGTSMASPHVAGAAALVKAADPSATAAGIKALLMSSGDPVGALAGKTASGARLNVGNAVLCDSEPQLVVTSPADGFVAGSGAPLDVSIVGTNCAHPAGATVTATANGAPLTLVNRGDGSYVGSVTPGDVGSLVLEARVEVGGVSKTRTISGTVVENYHVDSATYAWRDAVSGGRRLSLAVDDGSVSVALPFTFTYYDRPYTSVNVSSNGYLVFGSDPAYEFDNTAFPNSTVPNNVVACFWDDLNPARGGAIYTKTVGGDFVISWNAVPLYYVNNGLTFQAVLKPNGDVLCQYQDVMVGVTEFDRGASASIGGENSAGAIGYQAGYDEAVLSNGEAILFTGSAPVPDTTPPAAPSSLVATPGDRTVALDWADNGESDVAGYRVYRDSALIASSSASAYTDTGLTNGVTYEYAVTAVDRSGNESAAAAASATPTRPLVTKAYSPTHVIGVAGKQKGDVAKLRANDGKRLEWIATAGISDFYARATITASELTTLRTLTFAYDGHATSDGAGLEVLVYDFSGGTWESIFGPQTRVTSDRSVTWGAPAAANYVSAGGEVRLRVRATGSGSFRTRTDLVSFTIGY